MTYKDRLSWYRKARERVDNHRTGVYPRYTGNKVYPLEYIIMSLTFERLVKFCKAFDLPVRLIRTDKKDTLGFYYMHIYNHQARRFDDYFLDEKPNFFGKTWKDF